MKTIKKTPIIFGILSLMALLAFAKQEKVLQIFQNGEIIQEYAVSDIDYIEVNDLIPAPNDVSAAATNNQITIKWNPVEGATYNIYRSPDNVNFTLLASKLTETTYTDTKPLRGSNFYRVKAVVGDVESGYTSSAAATLTSEELASGIYLGITGFNEDLYNYPVLQLTENSVNGFRNFIDGLSMKFGTILYYSVDQAINTMQSTELPADISTAAIVTFTDGLDQGSVFKDGRYDDDMAFLDALNRRIKNETVSGQPITAFSIGIRGSDVKDTNLFRANLAKLASSQDNAIEVTSMSEVNAKFKEIAEKLSVSNYVQTISLKIPGVSNGTRIRFTFDNVNDANKSKMYIEGKFNLKERSLEEVKYVGLTSTSGTTIKGTVESIFVTFTFDGVRTDNNILIKSEFTDEWTYITSNGSWQINSEFDKTENSDIVTKRSSALIMLVLDCSSSLANDFVKAQTNAKDFISTLYQAVGGTENPDEPDESIYSTTPKDLSVAIWKNGTRYYLTPEQYKDANLSNVKIEGLTVLSSMANFIISPDLLQSGQVTKNSAMTYYKDLLPDKIQASVISTRSIEINDCLSNIGWKTFSTSQYISFDGSSYSSYYMTKTAYNTDYNYQINLYYHKGGNLAGDPNNYNLTWGFIRGVVPLTDEGPVTWTDSDDLKLSVIKDGERKLLSNVEDDLSQYDIIEGVYVSVGEHKFIVKLQNEQIGQITKESAMNLYSDLLPDYEQAKIISLKYYDINKAIRSWGGNPFVTTQYVNINGSNYSPYYMTKTVYDKNYNYQINLYHYKGGNLAGNPNGYNSTWGFIRGVIVP